MPTDLPVMFARNLTLITEFLLVGFGEVGDLKFLLFVFLLIIFIMALMGNSLVTVLVVVSSSLHSPMYFFISQMSLSEILFTSNIVPHMLWLVLVGGGKVSTNQCFLQFYLLSVSTVAQCQLLIVMSFDRYVAICKPFHYNMIMTATLQLQIVVLSWSAGFTLSLLPYMFLSKLEFCGPNIINHFFCDIDPVLQLSCSDTSSMQLVTYIMSISAVVWPFLFITSTYISIIHTIQKMTSTVRRQKAFSTCSSHLMVVCLYFGSLATIYIFSPKTSSGGDTNKYLSLLYILVTPVCNPLVYSLRNKDIKSSLIKYVHILCNCFLTCIEQQ
ncbi:olfactory receptor 10A4-like [Hyperolius riggenbachi]|uniref:olfactory receptor 10A4-like n=1 Tax=Hyperolius riggenbachi TaxID=752182 RepID=UPI0035A31FF8